MTPPKTASAETLEQQWRFKCESIAQATPREWGALDQRYYEAGLQLIREAGAAALRQGSKDAAELELRRRQMSAFPFCPDHRDKVMNQECYACRLERAESTALRQGDQAWQDIATAPKDGTLILGWNGGIQLIWYVDLGHGEAWVNAATAYELKRDRQPTHWMPLPPVPPEASR